MFKGTAAFWRAVHVAEFKYNTGYDTRVDRQKRRSSFSSRRSSLAPREQWTPDSCKGGSVTEYKIESAFKPYKRVRVNKPVTSGILATPCGNDPSAVNIYPVKS